MGITPLKVNLDSAKELIKFQAKQLILQPQLDRLRCIYLEGHAGLGKTQICRQAAEELTRETSFLTKNQPFHFRCLNLQFLERPDLMGLPYVEAGKTRFARPTILPDEDQPFGVLLFDEANRVDRDLRSAMLNLLEDREVNGHKIPRNWVIVLAGNPSQTSNGEGNYEVNNFDSALLDRVARVQVVGDVGKLVDYLRKKYENHFLVEFLNQNRGFISLAGDGITPRTFEYGIKAIRGVKDNDAALMLKVLGAEFGIGYAKAVFLWYQNQKNGIQKALLYSDLATGKAGENPAIPLDRPDVLGTINQDFVNDLRGRLDSQREFESNEIVRIQRYLRSIKPEFCISIYHLLRTDPERTHFTSKFLSSDPQLRELFLNLMSNRLEGGL